jgi:hypothetical protein
LLPNRFGAPVYGSLQRRVNAFGSISFHARQNVAVQVQRDPNLGMAKALAGDLGMNSVR